MSENNLNENKDNSEKSLNNINEINKNSDNSLNIITNKEINSNLTSEKSLISISNTPYEFKDEPIQLVLVSEDRLETTAEAINMLTGLKNQKLCILSINGPLSSGKTTLANKIIDKNDQGFKLGEKTQGIWMWGNPVTLNNGEKLLILDCQGLNKTENDISYKLFILSVLLSNCVVYNTLGELTEDKINDFIYFTDLSQKINVQGDNNDKLNNIDNLKEFFPELIFINNTLSKDNLQELVEKNPLCENSCKLFENKTYFNIENFKEILYKVRNDLKYKTIKNIIIDGYSLFGLLQNYIDFLNIGELPSINSALQNVILSKAKNESEILLEEFKNIFNKKLEYPMSFTNIYKIYLELQQKYAKKFCKKVEKILTPTQTGEYLEKLFVDMEKELESCLETNKDYYDEWFGLEYKELEEVLGKINLESNGQIKNFISLYTSTLQTCLIKFLNIPNTDFCKNLITILTKIFQDFVCDKLKKIGEKINDMNENYSKESNSNIEDLNSEIKKLKEQIDNNKKLLDDTNKEKSEINKNFLELETKFEKLSRESKTKEKEYENNLNIEIQKYQQMETYYNSQIKEKIELISTFKSEVLKLNKDILGSSEESILKTDELSKENIKLKNELEQIKNQNPQVKEKTDESKGENSNLKTLFINIQNTFMDLKNRVDKLDKENENVFKTKNLENSTKEIEGKLNICSNDLKNFFEKQIKVMNENYEKEIKKIKDEYDELNYELSKKKVDINEQTKMKEVCETKLKESVKQISELSEISKSKDSLIATQNEELKMYEDKIKDYKKMKEDLELSLAKNIYNYKMKEDEFDSLLMIIESIVSRKKERYEHNLNKLSPEIQTTLQALVKQYKFFK